MSERATFDPAIRFVRVTQTRADGMVAFEFAVGEPGLFVEMLLPKTQFDDFCTGQHVVPSFGALPDAPAGCADHEWDWSLRAAREQHFRREP